MNKKTNYIKKSSRFLRFMKSIHVKIISMKKASNKEDYLALDYNLHG